MKKKTQGNPGVNLFQNEDESHSVVVVEPRAKIGPIETSQNTSHLRSLVSAALLSETENPITVVCRYVNKSAFNIVV